MVSVKNEVVRFCWSTKFGEHLIAYRGINHGRDYWANSLLPENMFEEKYWLDCVRKPTQAVLCSMLFERTTEVFHGYIEKFWEHEGSMQIL